MPACGEECTHDTRHDVPRDGRAEELGVRDAGDAERARDAGALAFGTALGRLAGA